MEIPPRGALGGVRNTLLGKMSETGRGEGDGDFPFLGGELTGLWKWMTGA